MTKKNEVERSNYSASDNQQEQNWKKTPLYFKWYGIPGVSFA